jgi:hypothetical protein
MYLFRFAMLASFCLTFTAASAQEAPLTGPVILTVTGLDPAAFPDGQVEFDMPGLQALGEHQITTGSIWTKGAHLYSGVMLRTLADHLKIAKGALKLHALNDYAISLPLEEATADGPMLAFMLDSAPMSVRDKGPIWVVYPYDSDMKFRSDEIYARSVWQLDRIEVLP